MRVCRSRWQRSLGSRAGDPLRRPGAVRDVVQNHLLQVVSLLSMEPPVSIDPTPVRDERVKVLRAIRQPRREDLVRGQYVGYTEEPGVKPDSTTETYAALRLFIDSWRWSGVPVLIRAGKHLPVTATEVLATFHRPPQLLFDETLPRDSNKFASGLAQTECRSHWVYEASVPVRSRSAETSSCILVRRRGGRHDGVRATHRRRRRR